MEVSNSNHTSNSDSDSNNREPISNHSNSNSSSSSMGRLFEDLKGPYLVARFQRCCGVVTTTTTTSTTTKRSPSSHDDNTTPNPPPYKITNRPLHILFLVATSLGDETFYSLFFTFWFWSVDGAVGRRVVLVWAICMYIGQSLKDIVRWPRPSTPPVVKLESGRWGLEYGMPSTHAIVGASVPLALVYFTSSRYQYPVWIALTLSITICTMICLSRLYLGMHSILDIIAGLSLVALLLPFVIPLADKLDPFFFTHDLGAFTLLAVGLLLCLCYPSGDRWTPARGDTFVIVGSAVGMLVGAWLNYQMGINVRGPANPFPYAVMWPSWGMVGVGLLRQVLGLVIVLLGKGVAKGGMGRVRSWLLEFPRQGGDVDSGRVGGAGDDDDEKKGPGVVTELFTKFFTYVVVGFTVTCVGPAVFRGLGIERPSFHTEV